MLQASRAAECGELSRNVEVNCAESNAGMQSIFSPIDIHHEPEYHIIADAACQHSVLQHTIHARHAQTRNTA
jgi:hypothetical protein